MEDRSCPYVRFRFRGSILAAPVISVSVGDTYWVQSRTAPTPAAGTRVTVNDTAPTKDMWNPALVEVD